IKDLYRTAEAIGEQNVDKHFDQLMAQQRELISDFFRQSGRHGRPDAEPPATPEGAGGPADPPPWGAPYLSPPMVTAQAGQPVIAVLGLGEAGSEIARDLVTAGAM